MWVSYEGIISAGIYPTANVRDPILPFDQIHQLIADKLIDGIINLESELKSNYYLSLLSLWNLNNNL